MTCRSGDCVNLAREMYMALFYRRLPKLEYRAPHTLDEAQRLLSGSNGKVRVLAGGTDLIVRLKRREIEPPVCVVDLKGLPGLDTLSFNREEGLKLGALATIRTIARSPDVQEYYPALVQAALSMASPQVRNRGTFVGNICSAVPSADSAPPLIALRATVGVKGPAGERRVPIEEFFTGPRLTVVQPDEIVLDITVPTPAAGSRSVYLKLSPRHSMDLAIVGIAAWGSVRNGVCEDVRIGLGAVAPTPVGAPVAESMLKGERVTPELIDRAAQNAVTQCSPIDDHRASMEYRCDMVRVMTKRALTQVLLGG
jgi:CO/xanthine dehydrogenase FAD-binding subunit